MDNNMRYCLEITNIWKRFDRSIPFLFHVSLDKLRQVMTLITFDLHWWWVDKIR